MSVVDSSGWIEFLLGSDQGAIFREAILAADLVVPTVVIVEVRRWWLSSGTRVGDRGDLDTVTAAMSRGTVAPLSTDLAELAGTLGIRHRLPLADSIVYATGQALGQEVWTQDKDFEGLPGVRYLPKQWG